MPTIFFLRLGLIMGTGPSKIPPDIPLFCLLANLEPLWLSPDLKAQKLIFLSNQAWPQYQLDNDSKWSLDGTLNPNILRDLYTFVNALENKRRALMSRPSLTSTLSLLSVPLAPLPKSFWLWGAHAPSLWTETKPGIYSGMPHAMLGES
jgi:hypothetical protein